MKLFTARWFLVLIAIALLSCAIWYGGPYLAFGTYKPFEDVVGRLVGILALVVIWTLWVQVFNWPPTISIFGGLEISWARSNPAKCARSGSNFTKTCSRKPSRACKARSAAE